MFDQAGLALQMALDNLALAAALALGAVLALGTLLVLQTALDNEVGLRSLKCPMRPSLRAATYLLISCLLGEASGVFFHWC